MAFYVILANWTDEGIRGVRQSADRVEAFRREVESAGGRVHQFLYTMGIHDVVVVAEFPSDEALNRAVLRTGMQGFVRSVTLKAWSPAEFRALVEQL